jgi:hypothetical protein
MKITRRQIRSVLKEAIDVMNAETGETLVFDDDPYDGEGPNRPDAPEAAAMEIMKRLGIIDDAEFETGAFPEFGDTKTYSLPNDKWEMLEDEIHGKRSARSAKARKRRIELDMEMERQQLDKLLDRLSDWARDAATDYLADNPGTNIQDVAFDLADAWQFEFDEDDEEDLLYHFDGDVNKLKIYAAESMG